MRVVRMVRVVRMRIVAVVDELASMGDGHGDVPRSAIRLLRAHHCRAIRLLRAHHCRWRGGIGRKVIHGHSHAAAELTAGTTRNAYRAAIAGSRRTRCCIMVCVHTEEFPAARSAVESWSPRPGCITRRRRL